METLYRLLSKGEENTPDRGEWFFGTMAQFEDAYGYIGGDAQAVFDFAERQGCYVEIVLKGKTLEFVSRRTFGEYRCGPMVIMPDNMVHGVPITRILVQDWQVADESDGTGDFKKGVQKFYALEAAVRYWEDFPVK